MSCLDNIVTYSGACGEVVPSLSGYTLDQAPEISPINLSDVANEKYVSAANMVQAALSNAILDVRTDFLGVLAAGNYQVNLNAELHETSDFNTANSFPAAALERGITLYRNSAIKGSTRKLKIKTVSIYPKNNVANAEILIYDNGLKYTYNTTLVADMINTIEVNHVVQGKFARVLMDNSNVSVGSAKLICHQGCGGKSPNDCGWVKGYNGTGEISGKEGYGIGVDFYCECDFESILCDLSKQYVGKIIYLKARIKLLEERIYTNRINPLTVYGDADAVSLLNQLNGEYTETWNTFLNSLPNTLKGMRDDCISCKRITYKANI